RFSFGESARWKFQPHDDRSGARFAQLHAARTSGCQEWQGGPAERRLRARRNSLLLADGAGALPGGFVGAPHHSSAQYGAGLATLVESFDSARSGDDHTQVPPEGTVATLPDRAGIGG